LLAPYGNWESIDWTEMTGKTLRIFVDPVYGPFGLTKWQKLANS
jgi:hypothetical protein